MGWFRRVKEKLRELNDNCHQYWKGCHGESGKDLALCGSQGQNQNQWGKAAEASISGSTRKNFLVIITTKQQKRFPYIHKGWGKHKMYCQGPERKMRGREKPEKAE